VSPNNQINLPQNRYVALSEVFLRRYVFLVMNLISIIAELKFEIKRKIRNFDEDLQDEF
jgi:hypothetical protein